MKHELSRDRSIPARRVCDGLVSLVSVAMASWGNSTSVYMVLPIICTMALIGSHMRGSRVLANRLRYQHTKRASTTNLRPRP